MYDKVYRKAKNIVVMHLTTTEPASAETKNALVDLVIKDKKETVNFVAKTDSGIIGGFILSIEDSRLDASIKNQLNQLRLKLIKN
jgi:F-type H+-transporting ATPase subunit delta